MWFVHLIHLESLGKSILSSLRFTLYQLVPWLNLLDFHFLLEVSMSKYVKCCTLPDAAYHTSDAPAHRSCSLHQPEQKWMDREMSKYGRGNIPSRWMEKSSIWILYIWNHMNKSASSAKLKAPAICGEFFHVIPVTFLSEVNVKNSCRNPVIKAPGPSATHQTMTLSESAQFQRNSWMHSIAGHWLPKFLGKKMKKAKRPN